MNTLEKREHMPFVDFNLNPSKRQLRQFGAVCVLALPLVAWLWTGSAATAGWAGALGLGLCGVGMVFPGFLRPLFLGLTIVTLPIGLVTGEAAMLLIYFGLFLPMSLLLRIVGRDSLGRRNPKNDETFWQVRKQPNGLRGYYHQF